MKLVEVVSTISTAPDVAATAHAVCAKLGKHAVSCTDRAGFIVNALLFPYLNDAVKMLEAHYATADDIDAAMKVGCGYPMGPFELLDVVGLDVSLAIERELYIEFREPGFAPAPLLEHLVTAGYLGRKTGARVPRLRQPLTRAPSAPPGRLRPAGRPVRRAEPVEEAADGDWVVRPLTGAGDGQDLPLPGLRPGDPAGDAARRDLAGLRPRLRPRPVGHRVRRRPAPALAHRLLAGARNGAAKPAIGVAYTTTLSR